MVNTSKGDRPAVRRVWIDLDNSPHVPIFLPIIKELQRRGYPVILSTRDCFQVCGLADLHGLKYTKIGRHYGKKKLFKVAGTLYRSLQLLRFIHKARADLALSHGSRSQVLASMMMGMKSTVMVDYEYVAGHKVFRADFLIVPELIAEAMTKKGVHSRICTYPGIKEDLYVPEFKPDRMILETLGITGETILVTIRPPATEAHYHNPESEVLCAGVIEYLGLKENVRMVILPRNETKQGDMIRSRWERWINERKIIIPKEVVDGLNLIWHSDFVVSGGGTMNREAAALGVPVYSIFRGKIGAVDRYLSDKGKLVLLESTEDIKNKISLSKRMVKGNCVEKNNATFNSIINTIISILEN